MFLEYRDLITQLKHKDLHFTKLFERHNEIDQQIQNFEANVEQASELTIETLKKEKLNLKD
ncbi:MAG: hypothetical protein B7Y16_10150, partial [Methylotenera sp. 24-45-7]